MTGLENFNNPTPGIRIGSDGWVAIRGLYGAALEFQHAFAAGEKRRQVTATHALSISRA
jgi:hypothetical protein